MHVVHAVTNPQDEASKVLKKNPPPPPKKKKISAIRQPSKESRDLGSELEGREGTYLET